MTTTPLSKRHRQADVHSSAAHNGSSIKPANNDDWSSIRREAMRDDLESWKSTGFAVVAPTLFDTAAPWTAIAGLIFGGCCSNVSTRKEDARAHCTHQMGF